MGGAPPLRSVGRRGAGLALAALVATLVAAGGQPALAEENPEPRPARPPLTDSGPLPPKPMATGEVSTEDLPAGFASWQALFDEQRRLNGVADRIVAAGGAGYGGMVVDPENHDVRLYWKGALPAAVQQAVDAGRTVAPVRVHPAAYTDAELRAEAQRWLGSGLVSDAYPKADGSGVMVEVAAPESAGPPQLPGGAQTSYTVRYGQSAVVPVTGASQAAAEDDAVASPYPYSRQYDTSPFWGGSKFYSPSGGCTTGFAVTDNEGYAGLLTAGHCGEPGDVVTTSWAPDVIGQIWWDWDYQDISLVWVYSNVEGRVYTGPWSSTYGRPINSAATNYVGNYVCVNGASSGEHCAVKVYYVSPADVTVRAERTKAGACAAAHGDSGGPVISQSTGAAFGYGIISAGQNAVSTCWAGGVQLVGYHRVHYKGLKFALGYFGATLRTASYY